jgi:hypothetical protein
MGIMSVLPRTAYYQGLPKHFLKDDKFDFYWPELAHLGEQPVQNQEVWLEDTSGNQENTDWREATFGYQQRYAEYKYARDNVHGDFRTTLDFWHMARDFANRPALNESFVESIPTPRIFANLNGDKMWCQLFNRLVARRPMPYFADPRLT